MAWFGLCILLYDFASTFAFDELFQLCWYLTSALMLHLAMTFPEERQIVRSHPRVQLLIYLPSPLLWGFDRSIDSFFFISSEFALAMPMATHALFTAFHHLRDAALQSV